MAVGSRTAGKGRNGMAQKTSFSPDQIHASETLTMCPEQSDFKMHSHVNYEIYCFLEGSACYMVEGTRYDLSPGDVMLMAPGEVHHVSFSENTPYRRIVVNFRDLSPLPEAVQEEYLRPFHDRAFGECNHYRNGLFADRNFRFYLDELVRSNDAAASFAALLSLLAALSGAFDKLRAAPHEKNETEASRILSYISSHLTKPLSLDLICSRFYVSKTQLNRIFKAMTGATVWAYVTTKRLFLAREYILGGRKPTEAAELAGFRDYSAFYRAYRKEFNEAPKKIRRPRGTS